MTIDSLLVTLDVPREVRAGASVPFVLRVHNESARIVDLNLRGREIAFDIVVSDSAGREVWSRLHGQIVPAIIRLEPLGPGKALELRHKWNQRGNERRAVPPGEYDVQAHILTDGDPLRAPPRRFRILP
jgi:Intracellular proteinase inhibitor